VAGEADTLQIVIVISSAVLARNDVVYTFTQDDVVWQVEWVHAYWITPQNVRTDARGPAPAVTTLGRTGPGIILGALGSLMFIAKPFVCYV
jgi:hypothetical protein